MEVFKDNGYVIDSNSYSHSVRRARFLKLLKLTRARLRLNRQMKNRFFHFVLLPALLLSSSLACAQGVAQAGNKKPLTLRLNVLRQTSQKIPPTQTG